MTQRGPPKCWRYSTILHGITSQPRIHQSPSWESHSWHN